MFLGVRRRRLRGGHLPRLHPRLLQGLPLPRLGLGDPRAAAASRTCARWAACAKHMPHTYWTFLVATLAIAGIPPLAGFFSKDEILGRRSRESGVHGLPACSGPSALAHGGPDGLLHVPALPHDLLRRVPRHGTSRRHHLHESPASMTVPLMVLAVALDRRRLRRRAESSSTATGLGEFLEPVSSCRIAAGARGRTHAPARAIELRADGAVGRRRRRSGSSSPGPGSTGATRPRCRRASPSVRRASTALVANKYYVDELYDARLRRRARARRRALPVGVRRDASSTCIPSTARAAVTVGASRGSPRVFDQYVVDGARQRRRRHAPGRLPRLPPRADRPRPELRAGDGAAACSCLVGRLPALR